MMRAVAEGRVLEDGTPGYDEARTVWNAMVDRRPWAIVRCASADDVAEAIRYGRDRGPRVRFPRRATACSGCASRTAA